MVWPPTTRWSPTSSPVHSRNSVLDVIIGIGRFPISVAGDAHDCLRAIQVTLYCYGITLHIVMNVSGKRPSGSAPFIKLLSCFPPLSCNHFLVQRRCQRGVFRQTLADRKTVHPAPSAPRATPLVVTHRPGLELWASGPFNCVPNIVPRCVAI